MTLHESALAVLTFITIGFAVARFLVPVAGRINPADVYKNFAHLWVGFLFGAAYAMTGYIPRDDGGFELVITGELWALAVLLTLVEVLAFLVRRRPEEKATSGKGRAS